MDYHLESSYLSARIVSPGESLRERLRAVGMSQAELAQRMGRPIKTINGIIQGKVAITPETALQLERALGLPAHFWSRQEQHYRDFLARAQEAKELAGQVAWLQEIPVQAMIAQGWIQGCQDQVEQVREALNFFGVASPAQWRSLWSPLFGRTSTFHTRSAPNGDHPTEGQPGALAAWLRQGELEAQKIQCQPYEARLFQQILSQIRGLTRERLEAAEAQLVALCAGAGIALVLTPELAETHLQGATRWLTPHKALLQLKRDRSNAGQVWRTFFHCAGHLLLHGKRELFLESNPHHGVAEREEEADRFAAELLIPSFKLQRFIQQEDYASPAAIQEFAARLGIGPGLVVSRLQQEQL